MILQFCFLSTLCKKKKDTANQNLDEASCQNIFLNVHVFFITQLPLSKGEFCLKIIGCPENLKDTKYFSKSFNNGSKIKLTTSCFCFRIANQHHHHHHHNKDYWEKFTITAEDNKPLNK